VAPVAWETWLSEAGLGQFTAALRDLGMTELADLALLTDQDLEAAGFKLIQRRKYFSKLAQTAVGLSKSKGNVTGTKRSREAEQES